MVSKESSVEEAEKVIDIIRRKNSDGINLLKAIKKIEELVQSYPKKRTLVELGREINKKECDLEKTFTNLKKMSVEGIANPKTIENFMHLLKSSQNSRKINSQVFLEFLNIYKKTFNNETYKNKEKEQPYMEHLGYFFTLAKHLRNINLNLFNAVAISKEYLKLPYLHDEDKKQEFYISRIKLVNKILKHVDGINNPKKIDNIYKQFG